MALGGPSSQFLNARQIEHLGKSYTDLRHNKLLWDGVLGRHLYVVSGYKEDCGAHGKYYIVSKDSGFRLGEGHWRKTLGSFGCQGRLGSLRNA